MHPCTRERPCGWREEGEQCEDQNQLTGSLWGLTGSQKASASPGFWLAKWVKSAIGCIWEHRSRNRCKISDNLSVGHGDSLVSGGYVKICVDIQEASRKIWDAVRAGRSGLERETCSCQNVGG